jgi:hypothetical protein
MVRLAAVQTFGARRRPEDVDYPEADPASSALPVPLTPSSYQRNNAWTDYAAANDVMEHGGQCCRFPSAGLAVQGAVEPVLI